MPHFLQQAAYSRAGWEAWVANPAKLHCSGAARDRKLGGKIEAAWFSFADCDVVII